MAIRNKQLVVLSLALSSSIIQNLLWELSFATNIITLLFTAVLIEFSLEIKERYEKHRIFDKANLPSIDNTNPLSGNIYDASVRNNFSKYMLNYHKKLGKSIGLFFGPDPWVVTSDLNMLHQILVTESNKHMSLHDFRLPNFVFSGALLLLKGDQWRRARRALDPIFTNKHIKTDNIVQDLQDSVKKMLDCISSHPVSETGERTIDVAYNFTAYTIDVVFKIFLDRKDGIDLRVGQKDELVDRSMYAVENFISPTMYLSVAFDWVRDPLKYLKKFTVFGRHIDYVNSMIKETIQMRKKHVAEASYNMIVGSGEEKITRDSKLLDTVLSWIGDNRMRDLSPEAVAQFIFFAGYDTTSNSLKCIFWLLAQHQDVQDKLRQALIAEGQEATYLTNCIKETLRCYPMAPITGRKLAEDTVTEKGEKLFKGMSVIADIYSIHHDPDYWGQDVDQFKPERFDEPLKYQNQFFAFSEGPRGCIGKNFAMLNIKSIVTQVILHYKIEPHSSTPKELPWSVQNFFNINVKGPLNLQFIELNRHIEAA